MTGLVPANYSFDDDALPVSTNSALPDQFQGVFITLDEDHQEWIMGKIRLWFADRDEITLVDEGIMQKSGDFYAVLEWSECEVDQLFLSILEHEQYVFDYCVYVRDAVYEEDV